MSDYLKRTGWLERANLTPRSHESMPCFFLRREGDVVEAVKVDVSSLTFKPCGVCPSEKFYGHVYTLGQGEDVWRLM